MTRAEDHRRRRKFGGNMMNLFFLYADGTCLENVLIKVTGREDTQKLSPVTLP